MTLTPGTTVQNTEIIETEVWPRNDPDRAYLVEIPARTEGTVTRIVPGTENRLTQVLVEFDGYEDHEIDISFEEYEITE